MSKPTPLARFFWLFVFWFPRSALGEVPPGKRWVILPAFRPGGYMVLFSFIWIRVMLLAKNGKKPATDRPRPRRLTLYFQAGSQVHVTLKHPDSLLPGDHHTQDIPMFSRHDRLATLCPLLGLVHSSFHHRQPLKLHPLLIFIPALWAPMIRLTLLQGLGVPAPGCRFAPCRRRRFSFRLGQSPSVASDWPEKAPGHLQSPLTRSSQGRRGVAALPRNKGNQFKS
jgi:hypothetical protein